MIKEGAKVNGIRPEMVLAYAMIQPIFKKLGIDCVITEATGATHNEGSLHYVGLAIDIRNRDIPVDIQAWLQVKLQNILGSQYEVLLESDHYHIEFQPK